MNALPSEILADTDAADLSTQVEGMPPLGVEFTAPLNALKRSKLNVRKPGSASSIATLKASLLNHGQFNPLLVLPGKAGTWEVVAGGCRLDAFTELRREKKILKTFPVRLKRITPEMAVEISLAENIAREAMHPVDEYLAFARLIGEGACAQDVADRFGVSLAHVERRLKLGRLSPKLLELRREGQINDEQVKALTLSDSHQEQEAAWFEAPSIHHRTPQLLRSRLTREQIDAADDRWALFVGAEAYEAAGGRINRDLFAQDGTAGYWLDAPILARLVDEKLAALKATVEAEGWSWVEARNDKEYVPIYQFRRIEREPVGLSAEDEQEYDDLIAEKEQLEDPERGDLRAEEQQRLEEIETRLGSLDEQRCIWTPAQMAGAGVMIAIDRNGDAVVTRGLVNPDAPLPRQAQDDADREEGQDEEGQEDEEGQDEGEDPDDEGPQGGGGSAAAPDEPKLSAALVLDLSAQRTAALRAALMDRPDLALIAMVHKLMGTVFYGGYYETALELSVNVGALPLKRHAPDIEDGKAHGAMAERIGQWRLRIPYAHHEVWGWLLEQEQETVMQLLAVCTASTVNATQDKHDKPTGGRLTHANDLAAALRLDMREWWEPTAAGFFMRISRDQILDAVREQGGAGIYGMMSLKKTPLAIEASRYLKGSGWLPHMLRNQHDDEAGPEATDEQAKDAEATEHMGEAQPVPLDGHAPDVQGNDIDSSQLAPQQQSDQTEH